MSPSTAPASTDASCSGSPTRIRRASVRTASTNRAISDSETIDVSSTTTTSWARRFSRLWRNRLRLPGLKPRRRWSVVPRNSKRRARSSALIGSFPASSCTASSSRADALPVGAASATSGGRRPAGRLLVEQREDPRHRGGLACARTAGDDREPAQHSRGRRELLKVRPVSAREEADQRGGEKLGVDAVGRRPGKGEEVTCHLALLGPVTIEVQRRPAQMKGPVGPDEGAVPKPVDPVRLRRPREGPHVDGRVQVRARRQVDRGQVHAHVTEPGCADGERGRRARASSSVAPACRGAARRARRRQ